MHLGWCLSFSCHRHGYPHVCGFFTLILPCLFLLYPPSLFLFLSTTWSLWVNVHNSCNESMDPTDEFSLCTGYETKAHDFDEFSVEPYVQLLDSPPLFSWKVSSDPAYDDNALEDMLHQAQREQSYHSPREVFSVSLSSIMSTEEGVLLEIDWSDSVSTEAKIRTLLDNQKEQILAECQARSNQHEFQAARAEDEQQLLEWSMGGETCQIFGQVSHNVLYSTKKLLTVKLGPGRRDWRENNLHPGQISYGQSSGNQRESMPSWRRSKSGLRRSSTLKTHENCEGSISSTPSLRNTKKPLWTRERSWKHQWLLHTPCKIQKNVGVVHPAKLRQNFRVFWKLINPQECVWEIRCRIITKTILQEKVKIQYSSTIWFINSFLCLKLWKFLQRKQRWTRNGKNWRKFRCGTWRKSKVRNSDGWSKDVGHYSSFCIINGHLSSEKCWIGGKTPKIQRSSCTPRWYCKRWFRVSCSFHWTRIIGISNDSRQNHGYHLQIAWLRWTSSRRSIG